MTLDQITKHTKTDEFAQCDQLMKLLATRNPIVYAEDEPKMNRDGVLRKVIYLVQVRENLYGNLGKIQMRLLGWSPHRIVRTMLNVTLSIVEQFPPEEQKLYQQGAVWNGCIIRVFEQLYKGDVMEPKMIRDKYYKMVDGKYVYENKVIAELTDKDYVDFFYTDYETVEVFDDLTTIIDVDEKLDVSVLNDVAYS